jgi:hypothetical protein
MGRLEEAAVGPVMETVLVEQEHPVKVIMVEIQAGRLLVVLVVEELVLLEEIQVVLPLEMEVQDYILVLPGLL